MQRREANPVLVMDFDGVIVDSADEGLFTGFSAYKSFNPKTKLFGGNLNLDNFKVRMNKYRTQCKKYKDYRTFLRTALDYYYILHFIDKKIAIKNSSDFAESSKKVPVDKNKFVRKFYSTRSRLMRDDFQKWVKLEPIYLHMTKVFSELRNDVYVSTSNRKNAVLKTFRHFGMRIDSKHIFDNAFGLEKRKHIEKIRKIENADYSDMTFVDDQLGHLLNVKSLGVNCVLAGWGYVNEEQLKSARIMGIKVATPHNFVKILERISEKFIYV